MLAWRVGEGAALLDVGFEDVDDEEVEAVVFVVDGREEVGGLEEEEDRVLVLRVVPVEEDEPVRRLVLEARDSVARMLLRLAL